MKQCCWGRLRDVFGTSINHVHRLLKTDFSYAVEWGILAKNPVPKDGPKKSTVESAIWDRDTMVLALENMESESMLHLVVHLSIVGAMRLRTCWSTPTRISKTKTGKNW